MIRSSLSAAAVIAVSLAFSSAGASAAPSPAPSHRLIPAPARVHRGAVTPAVRGLPDNSGLPSTSFLTKAVLDTRVLPLVTAQNGTINSEELMPFASYQARFAPKGTTHGIGAHRMVWVVTATYPNGVQTDFGSYGPGTKVVAIFDAQTGQGISETYQGPLVRKKVFPRH